MRHWRMTVDWETTMLFLVGLCGWGLLYTAFSQPFLVKDAQPQAEIVIAEQPPRMTKLAAGELQTYIAKITGAKREG